MANKTKHVIPSLKAFPRTETGRPDIYTVLGGANANPIPWAELAETLKMNHESVGKLYYRQEAENDHTTHLLTVQEILDARTAGMRWQRIAARSGFSEAIVRTICNGEKLTANQQKTVDSYDGLTPNGRLAQS